MSAERDVFVCDNCLRASCFQGAFCCSKYKDAGVTRRTVKQLTGMKLENPSYWSANPSYWSAE